MDGKIWFYSISSRLPGGGGGGGGWTSLQDKEIRSWGLVRSEPSTTKTILFLLVYWDGMEPLLYVFLMSSTGRTNVLILFRSRGRPGDTASELMASIKPLLLHPKVRTKTLILGVCLVYMLYHLLYQLFSSFPPFLSVPFHFQNWKLRKENFYL